MKYALFSFIFLVGCATADPNRMWVKDWNSPYNSLEEQERIAEQMEKADYVRYRREVPGLVNKSFSSTPADSLERELVYFKIGLAYMDRVQYAYYNAERHKNIGPKYVEERLKNVPDDKARMGVYMRKLMELQNPKRMTKFLLCRMQELSGNWNACPSEIRSKVKPNALLWIFQNNQISSGVHTYLLEDFNGEDRRITSEKKGGGIVTVARTVCTGLVLCAGGFKGEDELVIQGAGGRIGLKLIYRDGPGNIEGENPL